MNADPKKMGLDPNPNSLGDLLGVRRFAESMGCAEQQVRGAVRVEGTSIDAVRLQLRLPWRSLVATIYLICFDTLLTAA